MLWRAHTVLAVVCVLLIPLTPLVFWLYAKSANVDRASRVAANERVFRSLTQPTGAVMSGRHTYPIYRWDDESALVPVSGYRTEFFVRLPRASKPRAIMRHYLGTLTGWQVSTDGGAATFTRGDVTVSIDASETAPGATRVRGYGVYVSQ